jgi:lipoprotein
MENKVLEMVTPVQLVFGCLVLLVLFIVACGIICRIKGRTALVSFIEKAELIFDWKGAGKQKLAYVLEQAQKLVKPPYSWFVNIQFVEKLVATLQPELKKLKETKEEANASNN